MFISKKKLKKQVHILSERIDYLNREIASLLSGKYETDLCVKLLHELNESQVLNEKLEVQSVENPCGLYTRLYITNKGVNRTMTFIIPWYHKETN